MALTFYFCQVGFRARGIGMGGLGSRARRTMSRKALRRLWRASMLQSAEKPDNLSNLTIWVLAKT